MPHVVPSFLFARDIASRLGCSDRTVRRYMARGLLPSAPRIGPRQRYGCEAAVLKARLEELIQTRLASNDNDETDPDPG